jgi:hypothetical protein
LSTLALETSRTPRGAGLGAAILRHGDLVVLALALPVFAVAGFSLLGYAAAAAAWLAQHAIWIGAERHAARALGRGDRNRAMGLVGFSTLGRVWLVTLAILLVGVLGEREAGLAAAVLCAVLVTVHLGLAAIFRDQGVAGTSAAMPTAAQPPSAAYRSPSAPSRSSRRGDLGK